MNILVAYYSHTNHTKGIAQAIAAECGADVEEIKEVNDRSGAWGYFGAGRDSLFKRSAPIQPTQEDPAQYDLVILGTPIWAWNLSPPMRAYISGHRTKFNQVAFFCTEGVSGGTRAFKQMADLIGKQPVVTLEITENDLKSGADKEKLQPFNHAIAHLSGGSHARAHAQTGS